MAATLQMTIPDLRAMSQPAAIDPDISATLSDFLTYTEHLPSAVIRSMTLIRTLNSKAYSFQKQIHKLTSLYSTLPTMTEDAPDPVQLRRDISHAYEKLEECKRMSAAEAVRIEDMVTRDSNRLQLVVKKLNALPLPRERDPTPEPVLSSPHLKRNAQAQGQAHQSAEKRVAAHRTTTAPRVRNRDKLMVPGEVLPPPNPDSPEPSEPDDWASPPNTSPQPSRPSQRTVIRQKTPKPPRPPKPSRDKLDKLDKIPKTPRPRPPGTPGTNAHSAVAGISTSNAIMALTRPPPDAKPGSKWLPWKILTEFELAILRKRMKKNAAWRPSPAMRNRELRNLGRGPQAMEDAKAEADAAGEPFIDEFTDAWNDPTRTSVSGEQQAEMNAILGPEKDHPDSDDALINRGMRLNEAKKLKRERQQAEETALKSQPQEKAQNPPQQKPKTQPQTITPQQKPQQQQPEDQIVDDEKPEEERRAKPSEADSKKRKRDATPAVDSPKPAAPRRTSKPPPNADNTSHKRKREATPPASSLLPDQAADSPDVLTLPPRPAPERKKLRINPPAPPTPTATEVAPAVLPSKSATPAAASPRVSTRPRSQRASAAPQDPPAILPPTTRSSKTTITIKRPKAASAEPPMRRALRRGSNASLPGGGNQPKTQSPAPPKPATQTSAESQTRRKKRPVPGVVAAEEDGSAKLSIGKRQRPPKKQAQQAKGAAAKKEETPVSAAANAATAPEELVDPDEERYCICGDVSFGTMIACDNESCEKEWFHLECVGLADMPPRRAKWYCPDCRKKLKLGQTTNGIVPQR
ncbi:hypothetical protein BDV97DRAFT_350636 [Delphinella strobiligena]|nr:hypothetical protein BDV97DRAFT_350636 [Delphinella strobiligena]